MGRKKIEIKPLTDERNRNVTFLKRKAGLMKKAYELSVLCGVSVSLLIFSANGKPYEFSSTEFDNEVDRYNEYEGMIERRRAAEFEAMALAGEDGSDDDDGPANKGAKPNGPSKSLKGKESFKARRQRYRDGQASRHRDHHADRKPVIPPPGEEPGSFIGGVIDDGRRDISDEPTPPPPRSASPSSAGLSYALGLHQQQQQQQQASWNPYARGGATQGFSSGGYPFPGQAGGSSYLPTPGVSGSPLGVPGLGSGLGNMPWEGGGHNNQALTTYAWLQIQQAHHEQKRQLLEKQHQQLYELTSRTGNNSFLRDMLGGNGVAVSNNNTPGSGSASSWNDFVWPTAPADELAQPNGPVSSPPEEDLVWALSGGSGGRGSVSQQGMLPPQASNMAYSVDYANGGVAMDPMGSGKRPRDMRTGLPIDDPRKRLRT
ncbi:hypothetical protein Q8F55_001141 [Vanrija albida]|uniref:MADS-box domain-containing protein n=1 Tax=Vanrija albida TaxID=181172 RepID=A0ABR3QF83_9TREE